MKKLFIAPVLWGLFLSGSLSQAKLNDQQIMNCISQDKQAQSALLDLEQAYEMRSVSAKDFFQAFDKAENCSKLKKNLQKLHADLLSTLRTPQEKAPSFLE